MNRFTIDVVENATNVANLMPETPNEKVVADCMKDYLEYRKAEEQGLLLRLPVSEGATVYFIKNNSDCCGDCNYFEEGGYGFEDMCRKHDYRQYPQYADEPVCENQFLEVIEYKPSLDWIFNSRKLFGKTVYLTKAEAEKALAEMEGKCGKYDDR